MNKAPSKSPVGSTTSLGSAGSFYFSLPYTEGLFLLLVAGTLLLARQGRYETAGLVAGLAAVTRVQGLALIAAPLLACWLEKPVPVERRAMRIVVSAALFALPVGVYLLYLADVLKVELPELFPKREAGRRIHEFMEHLETTRF